MNPIRRFQLTTQTDGRDGGEDECKLSSYLEASYKDTVWIAAQAELNDLTNFI
jgi:hypothetical protein